jgi:hypothetical protein
MGRVADVCQSASQDDLGSYDGEDSEVKMTRPDAAALHWQLAHCAGRGVGSRPEAA